MDAMPVEILWRLFDYLRWDVRTSWVCGPWRRVHRVGPWLICVLREPTTESKLEYAAQLLLLRGPRDNWEWQLPRLTEVQRVALALALIRSNADAHFTALLAASPKRCGKRCALFQRLNPTAWQCVFGEEILFDRWPRFASKDLELKGIFLESLLACAERLDATVLSDSLTLALSSGRRKLVRKTLLRVPCFVHWNVLLECLDEADADYYASLVRDRDILPDDFVWSQWYKIVRSSRRPLPDALRCAFRERLNRCPKILLRQRCNQILGAVPFLRPTSLTHQVLQDVFFLGFDRKHCWRAVGWTSEFVDQVYRQQRGKHRKNKRR